MNDSKVMKLYRLENYLYKKKVPLLPKIICKLIRIIFSAEIPYTCELGENVQLKHGGLGIVIHDDAIIGANTIIYQHVTIGGRENRGHPTIGENVYIGAGACVLGKIHVSNNVRIGANAVVLNDVPEGMSVGGVPAENLHKK
jgi:serine O-acetyltransferase